jgi:excisionase family DNA binding protein
VAVAVVPRAIVDEPAPVERYMTLHSAADRYGISERSIRRRITEGALRAYQIGPRAIRVAAEDVEKLARPTPTTEHIERRPAVIWSG